MQHRQRLATAEPPPPQRRDDTVNPRERRVVEVTPENTVAAAAIQRVYRTYLQRRYDSFLANAHDTDPITLDAVYTIPRSNLSVWTMEKLNSDGSAAESSSDADDITKRRYKSENGKELRGYAATDLILAFLCNLSDASSFHPSLQCEVDAENIYACLNQVKKHEHVLRLQCLRECPTAFRQNRAYKDDDDDDDDEVGEPVIGVHGFPEPTHLIDEYKRVSDIVTIAERRFQLEFGVNEKALEREKTKAVADYVYDCLLDTIGHRKMALWSKKRREPHPRRSSTSSIELASHRRGEHHIPKRQRVNSDGDDVPRFGGTRANAASAPPSPTLPSPTLPSLIIVFAGDISTRVPTLCWPSNMFDVSVSYNSVQKHLSKTLERCCDALVIDRIDMIPFVNKQAIDFQKRYARIMR